MVVLFVFVRTTALWLAIGLCRYFSQGFPEVDCAATYWTLLVLCCYLVLVTFSALNIWLRVHIYVIHLQLNFAYLVVNKYNNPLFVISNNE
jgi:hypothetical protein